MNKISNTRIMLLACAGLLTQTPRSNSAQEWGASRLPGAPSYAPLSSALQTVFGASTNGVHGGVAILPAEAGANGPVVCVFVSNSNPGEIIALEDSGTNFLPTLIRKQESEWLYYMGTNSFCGPIELRDTAGRILQTLDPGVSEMQSYPAHYNWTEENLRMLRRRGGYLGTGIFPNAILGISSTSELVRLDLSKYFNIEQPGEYKFTVWPKIYKRVAKTNDLCLRIDVPPVTATVKIEKLKQK